MNWVLVLFVLAYTALTVAAFWVANSESSKATVAMRRAGDAYLDGVALRKETAELTARIDSMLSTLMLKEAALTGLREKLASLEGKFVELKTMSPAKLVLAQDKPFRFTILHKDMGLKPRASSAPVSVADELARREKLMKEVKKKIKSLSQ